MAVFNEPAQWDHTLGNNADTSTLPDDATATAGIASLQKLFQLINATPLEAGGIAPDREDVNALFKYLGDQIFYTQNGGIPSYNAAYDYVAGRVVSYNGNIYKCIQANGASSTVVAPDSNTAYWQRLDNFVRSVNGVNADAQGNVQTGFPGSSSIYIANDIANPAWNPSEAWVTHYIAPANGFVTFRAQIPGPTGNQGLSTIYVDTGDICSYIYLPNTLDNINSGCWIGDTIPVAKGQTVKVAFNNLKHFFAHFIYAEGEI